MTGKASDGAERIEGPAGSSPLVVLVDESDVEIGVAEKLECHRSGKLHRAVSVNVVDPNGNILLQRRAAEKYHSPGLWSNACCSHPGPDETPRAAAQRRLAEEMGIACDLEFRGLIRYRSEVGAGLVENELVHFFIGVYDGPVSPDCGEVERCEWIAPEELFARLWRSPEEFSAWFRIYVERGAI